MKHTLQHRSLEKQLLFRSGHVLEAAERLAINNKGQSQKGKKCLLKVIFHEKHGNAAKKKKIGDQDVIASLLRSQTFKVKGSGKEDLFPN